MRVRACACVCPPTLYGDVERAAVTLVLGGDLAAVASSVPVHHLDDAHLVGVDLRREGRDA